MCLSRPQVSAAVSPDNEQANSFRECVIIRHPRRDGEFAFAFITGQTVLQVGRCRDAADCLEAAGCGHALDCWQAAGMLLVWVQAGHCSSWQGRRSG